MGLTSILSVLLIGFGLSNVAECQCLPSFTLSNSGNRCFAYVRFSASWPYAVTMCRALGAELVQPYTLNIQADMESFILSDDRVSARLVWAAAYDLLLEGSWIWFGPRDMAYDNWSSGQPSNGSSAHNCLAFRAGYQDYGWEDSVCDAHKHYVCVQELTTVMT